MNITERFREANLRRLKGMRLMHDFSCTEPDDMKYPVLAEQVRYFKENKEGVNIMCRAMEEMCNEVAQFVEAESKKEFALKLLKKGKDSFEEISELTELSLEEIQILADSLKS